MIKVTDRWSVYRDADDWTLIHQDGAGFTYPLLDEAFRYAAKVDTDWSEDKNTLEEAYNTLCEGFTASVSAFEVRARGRYTSGEDGYAGLTGASS